MKKNDHKDTTGNADITDRAVSAGVSGLSGKWKNLSDKDRSLLKKLGICLVLGIILLNMNLFTGTDSNQDSIDYSYADTAGGMDDEFTAVVEDNDLEQRLAAVLSRIKGAGNVSVIVYYSESAASVYATEIETSFSEDSSEGSLSTSENDNQTIAAVNDKPVLIKKQMPMVEGVVVVASGAADVLVQERLFNAVKSLLGLNASQIAVIEGE